MAYISLQIVSLKRKIQLACRAVSTTYTSMHRARVENLLHFQWGAIFQSKTFLFICLICFFLLSERIYNMDIIRVTLGAHGQRALFNKMPIVFRASECNSIRISN